MPSRKSPGSRLLPVAVLLTALACSAVSAAAEVPDGRTWLAIVDGDTTTVAEAAMAWGSLEPAVREQYIALEDPAGTFVRALARNGMVVRELDRLGYAGAPEVSALEEAWARRYAKMWLTDSLSHRFDSLLTRDDLDYFAARFGKLVWITVAPGSQGEVVDGPLHIPELARSLALHLDSLEAGEALPGPGGVVFRLDSVILPDSAQLAIALSDTTSLEEYARRRLATVRTGRQIAALSDSIWSAHIPSPVIRPEGIERFVEALDGEMDYSPSDTLLVSGLGALAASDLLAEMQTLGNTASMLCVDTIWVRRTVLDMSVELAILEYLGEDRPTVLAEIGRDARGMAMEYAAGQLYEDSVRSRIQTSEEMLAAEYEALEEPPWVPERRSLMVAVIQPSQMGRCREALAAGRFEAMVDSLGYWPGCSAADPPTRTTVPLLREELPAGADSVFSLQPSDSLSWHGPWELPDSSFVMYRLVHVLPGHAATLDEMRMDLTAALRGGLEEERALEWVGLMASRYRMRINTEVLDRLPDDPSEWASRQGDR
jgi:hypothetical protein